MCFLSLSGKDHLATSSGPYIEVYTRPARTSRWIHTFLWPGVLDVGYRTTDYEVEGLAWSSCVALRKLALAAIFKKGEIW